MKYRGKKHYEEAMLREIVSKSHSKREVLIELGLPTKGTYGYRTLNYFLFKYSIAISHFSSRNVTFKRKISLESIIAGEHPRYNSGDLKKRLISAGLLSYCCSECGIDTWRGKPAPLDLDHINGVSWDHRLSNLRLLCRNCHAQTETFCGKNSKGAGSGSSRKKRSAEQAQKNREAYAAKQQLFIPLVEASAINFSKSGWVGAVAEIINQKPQLTREWMKRFMPEFEKTCFRRAV